MSESDITTIILRELRERTDVLRDEVRQTNARLEAHTEMTNARFSSIENVLVELSARTHMLSGDLQLASTRYARELDDVRTRVAKLEPATPP